MKGRFDQLLSGIEHVGSEYQVVLDRKEDGKNYTLLKVERTIDGPGTNDAWVKRTVEHGVRKQLLVNCDVEITGYGELPRTEKKTKRVFDNRD